jgi:hypothetical protein
VVELLRMLPHSWSNGIQSVSALRPREGFARLAGGKQNEFRSTSAGGTSAKAALGTTNQSPATSRRH